VVRDKRTLTTACGLLVAAGLALAACAPNGYGSGGSDNEAAAPALANATGSPDASEPPAENNDEGNTADVKLTTELKAGSVKRMGKVITDQGGWVLYLFTKDSKDPSKSTCYDKCAKTWPPALTDGNANIEGISADLVGTVTRDDGTKQLTVGGWPVYRYIGDKKPGQWKGQGVGGTWWVIGPNGKKNLTCVPTATPKPVQPPADSSNSDSSSGGGYSY
jgi:predicted lipoprotein with Yx(FWY)xxD motif